MKENIKYLLIVAGIIIAIGVIFLVISKSGNKDTTPFREQSIDGLKISNVTITYENGVSSYKGKVKATKDINVKFVKINVTKDGKDYELVGYIGKELKNGEEVIINASYDKDITNPSDIKYSLQLND